MSQEQLESVSEFQIRLCKVGTGSVRLLYINLQTVTISLIVSYLFFSGDLRGTPMDLLTWQHSAAHPFSESSISFQCITTFEFPLWTAFSLDLWSFMLIGIVHEMY